MNAYLPDPLFSRFMLSENMSLNSKLLLPSGGGDEFPPLEGGLPGDLLITHRIQPKGWRVTSVIGEIRLQFLSCWTLALQRKNIQSYKI